MNVMAYRNAMYAPPFKAVQNGAVNNCAHQPGPANVPLSPLQPLAGGLTFNQMPKPPSDHQRTAMAPLRPPHQDEPSLESAFDDSSSVSTRDDLPVFHSSPQQMYSVLEWRLRRQSNRLRKKLRTMRRELRQLYEAIYYHLKTNQATPKAVSSPSAPTSLWCLVVGLAVAFVFLLILIILCWVRSSPLSHSPSHPVRTETGHGVKGSNS